MNNQTGELSYFDTDFMQPDKFTTLTQQAFQDAQNDANERGHSELTNEHLLRAFLDQADGVTRPLLEKVGVSTPKLGEQLDAAQTPPPKIVSRAGPRPPPPPLRRPAATDAAPSGWRRPGRRR